MMHRTLVVLLALAGASACYATVEPTPVGTVQVTSGYIPLPAPVVTIETSPWVDYQGHRNYYYGGRWYYRDRNEWRYYRDEPHYLQQQRPRVEREWQERQQREHYYRQPGPPPPHQPPPPPRRDYPRY